MGVGVPALNLWAPAGSLTGKTTVATIAYLVSWPNLHVALRKREVDLRKGLSVAGALVVFELLATFPPFFALFHAG